MVSSVIPFYLFDLDPILKPFRDFPHTCIKFISFLLDGQVNPLYLNTIVKLGQNRLGHIHFLIAHLVSLANAYMYTLTLHINTHHMSHMHHARSCMHITYHYITYM